MVTNVRLKMKQTTTKGKKTPNAQQHLHASRGFVLRMTEIARFEVQYFVESSVVIIPACV